MENEHSKINEFDSLFLDKVIIGDNDIKICCIAKINQVFSDVEISFKNVRSSHVVEEVFDFNKIFTDFEDAFGFIKKKKLSESKLSDIIFISEILPSICYFQYTVFLINKVVTVVATEDPEIVIS